jgi:hypothetical protein
MTRQIGRASCRERVYPVVELGGGNIIIDQKSTENLGELCYKAL